MGRHWWGQVDDEAGGEVENEEETMHKTSVRAWSRTDIAVLAPYMLLIFYRCGMDVKI
jgi:hypothetical protein